MDLNTFFLVVPPGLENLAAKELAQKIPGLSEIKSEKGGIEVAAPFELGLAFNHTLKIPAKILLRIAQFKCRDLPKLYNKISNIRWGQFLIGENFDLSVASSKSRLLNEKKIEGSVREGIARHFQKQPAKKTDSKFAFEIQVRFFDDICTISLNLSGEPLFKRGYKKMSARAPIRENLSAALYYALISELGEVDSLIDPMCGSGSLLLESHEFWRNQYLRRYAYQEKLGWLAAEAGENEMNPLQFLYAYDRDQKALQDLQENLAALSKDSTAKWVISLRDIMSDEPIQVRSEKLAFICNPPYGERIRLPKPAKEYYPSLLEKMLRHHPIGVGIIIPQQYTSVVPKQISGYTLSHEWSFENGGLPVVFRVYKQ